MAPASYFSLSLPRTKLESRFQESRTIVKFSSEAKVKKQEPKYVFLTKLKAKNVHFGCGGSSLRHCCEYF
jgi:hypothetical protein